MRLARTATVVSCPSYARCYIRMIDSGWQKSEALLENTVPFLYSTEVQSRLHGGRVGGYLNYFDNLFFVEFFFDFVNRC